MDFSTLSLPIIIVITLLSIIGISWVISRRVTHRWNRHRAETVAQWEQAGLEFIRGPAGGQFIGLESLGPDRSLRGLGFVALTEQDLRVTRSVPSEVWILTYKQIKGVTLQSKFLGREAKTNPFIVVRFVKDGKKDKLAFSVKEGKDWAKDLARVAKVKMKF
ncbi:MAG: hypothetical protein AAF485_06305 [Chloroflexota bacterium]